MSNNNIRTLSTTGVESGDDVEGLLYVPTLAAGDPCRNASGPYIPRNATQLANLPQTDYPYIAFAPWINAQCTLAFLNAASAGSDAFLTYLLDNGTNTPPPLVSPVWNLNDGGAIWSQLRFPVYAIPGASGVSIMQQMALYSGNLTSAPNANILLQQFMPTDYVRLYSTFDTGSASHYPTLWAFLLIILGIVLIIVGITSCTMHYKQRRARSLLRRRVIAGEVDLESLGLAKPPRITQSDVDELPQVIYTASEQKPPLPLDSLPQPSKTAGPAMVSPQNYNQPTCPICLDDYIAGKTTVRRLPCQHIYHPSCIDPHLLLSSSLCPVCKARVPSAQERAAAANGSDPNCTNVPVITNVMVRRERHMRLLRERRAAGHDEDTRAQWVRRRFGRPILPIVGSGMRAETMLPTRGSRGSSTIVTPPVEPTGSQIEMSTVPAPSARQTLPAPSTAIVPALAANPNAIPYSMPDPTAAAAASLQTPASPRPPAEDTEGRREWARRRASALLHRQSIMHPGVVGSVDVEEEERQRIASLPRWRKVVGGLFPGFRN